jgi:hypothetical protein
LLLLLLSLLPEPSVLLPGKDDGRQKSTMKNCYARKYNFLKKQTIHQTNIRQTKERKLIYSSLQMLLSLSFCFISLDGVCQSVLVEDIYFLLFLFSFFI